MAEILPAILPKHFEDLKDKVGEMRGLVPMVQIDLCDGKFVPTVSWPFHENDAKSADDILNEREGMPYWDEVNFELDLMVADAVVNFENYLKMGARRIVFHIEAVGDLGEFKEFLEGIDLYVRENVDLGIAINNDTSLDTILPLISNVDYVQCMGIKQIGKQGEMFDERVLERIKELKAQFPELIISIDGSVNEETAPRLLQAGADRLVIGSAIWESEDIIGSIYKFKEL
jgi:ribulose-phosphate 3-epimerase